MDEPLRNGRVKDCPNNPLALFLSQKCLFGKWCLFPIICVPGTSVSSSAAYFFSVSKNETDSPRQKAYSSRHCIKEIRTAGPLLLSNCKREATAIAAPVQTPVIRRLLNQKRVLEVAPWRLTRCKWSDCLLVPLFQYLMLWVKKLCYAFKLLTAWQSIDSIFCRECTYPQKGIIAPLPPITTIHSNWTSSSLCSLYCRPSACLTRKGLWAGLLLSLTPISWSPQW